MAKIKFFKRLQNPSQALMLEAIKYRAYLIFRNGYTTNIVFIKEEFRSHSLEYQKGIFV
ncbi:hypothetical protein [Nostoc sp. 106C]|uniref:hypothetical protein n=1 Tax=Nostoc sp. 106C TaxID=1932667 RepID=UPI001411C36D|nr:hypothetical protein [Nostoc sp. 106C]